MKYLKKTSKFFMIIALYAYKNISNYKELYSIKFTFKCTLGLKNIAIALA